MRYGTRRFIICTKVSSRRPIETTDEMKVVCISLPFDDMYRGPLLKTYREVTGKKMETVKRTISIADNPSR
jgi:hypothetical protein